MSNFVPHSVSLIPSSPTSGLAVVGAAGWAAGFLAKSPIRSAPAVFCSVVSAAVAIPWTVVGAAVALPWTVVGAAVALPWTVVGAAVALP
jgi:hypothetical protein